MLSTGTCTLQWNTHTAAADVDGERNDLLTNVTSAPSAPVFNNWLQTRPFNQLFKLWREENKLILLFYVVYVTYTLT